MYKSFAVSFHPRPRVLECSSLRSRLCILLFLRSIFVFANQPASQPPTLSHVSRSDSQFFSPRESRSYLLCYTTDSSVPVRVQTFRVTMYRYLVNSCFFPVIASIARSSATRRPWSNRNFMCHLPCPPSVLLFRSLTVPQFINSERNLVFFLKIKLKPKSSNSLIYASLLLPLHIKFTPKITSTFYDTYTPANL